MANNKTNANQNEPLKFNQAQYEMLKRCSDKKDMTEWNQYRIDNPDVDIELEGFKANFYGCYLKGARLYKNEKDSGEVYLREANFQVTNLQNVSFGYAHLEGTRFGLADLQNAYFYYTHLENAHFSPSNLEGANFTESYLRNTTFKRVFLDGKSIFWDCTVNKYCSPDIRGTDFTGSQLNVVRIGPGMKQQLEYNIRRMNWEDWYKKNKFLSIFVRLFWWASDYGASTLRLFFWFLGLAAIFALDYWAEPKLVLVNGGTDTIRSFLHALYFSVVTMTTLGFGDIAANPDSWQGQVLLMIQVILGYVLLGALITRLAILFTSDGPAGKFSPIDKKTKRKLAENEIASLRSQ